MEKKNCYKAQMYDWLQTLYGNSDNFNWSQVGLPADKVRHGRHLTELANLSPASVRPRRRGRHGHAAGRDQGADVRQTVLQQQRGNDVKKPDLPLLDNQVYVANRILSQYFLKLNCKLNFDLQIKERK